MKQVVLQGKKAWIEDAPDPKSEKGWVVAKVLLTPICGSDKAAFGGMVPARNAGHEGVGVIVDAGSSYLLKNGDRVSLNPLTGCGTCEPCRSGDYIFCKDPHFGLGNIANMQSHFAQFVKIPDFVCSVLPADIPDEIGTLAGCALGPAFRGIDRMVVTGLDTLLITGLGPVGLGAVSIAKFRGARVVAVDVEPYRRSLAQSMGADVTLEPDEAKVRDAVMQITHGRDLKKAIDCSGNPAAERMCINLVGINGTVAFAGENFGEIPVSPSNDFIRKGLTVFGSWHYNLNDFPRMAEILRHSPVVGKIITHTYGFSKVQEAFDTFISGKTGKVLLNPWA